MHKLSYLLQHYFFNSVKNNPEKTALVIDHEEYTYQMIRNDCLHFSDYLKENGVMRGDRILIQAGNTYLTIIAYWAALFCDAVACIIDLDMNVSVLKNLIQKIDPAVIVANYDNKMQHDAYQCSKKIVIHELIKKNKIPEKNLLFRNTESDLAMIIHTSGSTGEPKGVMLSHRNVIAAIDSISVYLQLQSNDIILSVLPLHFDYGLYQMLLSFANGATLVLEKNCLFPALVAQKISRHKITVLPCIPLLVQLFYLSHEHYSHDFSSVRMVTNTGENLSPSHIEKIKTLFSTATIFSMYGLTECKRCSYVPPENLNKKMDSVGIAMPNLEMWVEDFAGNRLNPGCEGELMVSGPTVMLGYWKNHLATQAKIKITDGGRRVLKTGDRATMDQEGYFYFKGRNDFILKYKGIKLNTQEIIKKIISHHEVDRCHLFINGDRQLIVCVECSHSLTNKDELMQKINAEFPGLQKPDHIYFTDRFPALSNGKLDTFSLQVMAGAACN